MHTHHDVSGPKLSKGCAARSHVCAMRQSETERSLNGQSDGRSPRKRRLQHQLTTATRLTFRSGIG
eukprot:37639-Prymnesium_polylepis.1